MLIEEWISSRGEQAHCTCFLSQPRTWRYTHAHTNIQLQEITARDLGQTVSLGVNCSQALYKVWQHALKMDLCNEGWRWSDLYYKRKRCGGVEWSSRKEGLKSFVLYQILILLLIDIVTPRWYPVYFLCRPTLFRVEKTELIVLPDLISHQYLFSFVSNKGAGTWFWAIVLLFKASCLRVVHLYIYPSIIPCLPIHQSVELLILSCYILFLSIHLFICLSIHITIHPVKQPFTLYPIDWLIHWPIHSWIHSYASVECINN